jgi:hypothetical protein
VFVWKWATLGSGDISNLVIAGLDPAIHAAVKHPHVCRLASCAARPCGPRVKPGGDDWKEARPVGCVRGTSLWTAGSSPAVTRRGVHQPRQNGPLRLPPRIPFSQSSLPVQERGSPGCVRRVRISARTTRSSPVVTTKGLWTVRPAVSPTSRGTMSRSRLTQRIINQTLG